MGCRVLKRGTQNWKDFCLKTKGFFNLEDCVNEKKNEKDSDDF